MKARRWSRGGDGGFRALLVLVSAVVFVDTVFFTAVTPLLPHYAHALHLSKGGAGILVAAYPIGTLVSSIPGGMLASRIGLRAAVLTGLGLMSIATLLFGFGSSAVVLDSARFVQGVGGACTWAGSLAWLASGAPPTKRAGAFGVAFGAAIGGSLFGPVVGAVASRVGTRPAFAGATAAAVVLVVATLFVAVPESEASPALRDAFRALRDVSLLGGMWLTFLSGLAFGVVDVLVPLRLSSLGGTAILIGAAFLGAAGLEATISPLVGRMADRRGRMLPVRASLSVAAVVAVLLPFASPAALLVPLVVVGLPSFSTVFVPAAALISDGAARRHLHQGLGFGLSNLAWAGGQGVAAAGSGALAQATSDLVPYLLLAAAIAATLIALGRRGRTFVTGRLSISPARVEGGGI